MFEKTEVVYVRIYQTKINNGYSFKIMNKKYNNIL